MTTEQEHSRLIAEAAKEVLEPLAVRRKGRSRTWIDDRAWWLGIVEFQPSSWSKGSYLNVGVMWLWEERPYYAYSVGGRTDGFERYVDSAQFREVARRLAHKAAKEVSKYRRDFASLTSCAHYFATLKNPAPYFFLSGGIALGLVGMTRESRQWFDAYLAVRGLFDSDWVLEEKRRARELRDLLDDHAAFLNRVRGSIARTRELLRLPPLSDSPF